MDREFDHEAFRSRGGGPCSDDDRIAASRLPQASAYRTVFAAHHAGNSNPLLSDFLAATRRAVRRVLV